MRSTALLPLLALGACALVLAGCATASTGRDPSGKIIAVGAENEYANVISQIGGKYVSVSAIESNPNTDPHTFEASPSVASTVSSAGLIVQNGVGYDDFMSKIESASPNPGRRVIDVQKLLGVAPSAPNPHLWYKPGTMSAVAGAVASDLGGLEPAHAAYFRANAARFDASLESWYRALAQLRSSYGGVPVATTEPVGDYMVQAAGAVILTPPSLEQAVMNGTDPAPQNVTLQTQLLEQHRVRALLYNRQVTDSLTQTLLSAAAKGGVPVVGVYETMPPGYDYQSWMLAEADALRNALENHVSTRKL